MGNSFSKIRALVSKELKSQFDNIASYVVIILFLFLWEFLYFRSAYVVGEASLRGLFDLLPWLLLILAPAITMGTIAGERQSGTIELSLTHPITELQYILAKVLSSFIYAATAISLTLPIPLIFSKLGNLDIGSVAGQYFGSLLVIFLLVSLGVFVSSLFKSQIAALLTTAAVSFFLIVSGTELVTLSLPSLLSIILEKVSLLTHFSSISRGVIDLRDIFYFFGISITLIFLTYLNLIREKFGAKAKPTRQLLIKTILIFSIFLLLTILSDRNPLRFDLTRNKNYSLSSSTIKIARELPDIVNLTLYASQNLPAQFQSVLRDTKDTLNDYKLFSRGNIRVSIKNPAPESNIEEEANALGIQPVQFNVMSKEQFQVQSGYLGLVISYQDQNEVIPFIQRTDNLEYQLTSLIHKLTAKEKKEVAFLTGHEETVQNYATFRKELEKQYQVSEIQIPTDADISENIQTLIIAGPTKPFEEKEVPRLRNFLNRGNSIFLMFDPVTIDLQTGSPSKNSVDFSKMLKKFGLGINNNLIFDLRSNETITYGGGLLSYIIPYPLWVKAQIADSSPVTSGLETISLAWAGSLSVNADKTRDRKLIKLLETTEFAGEQKDSFDIRPDQEFALPKDGGKKYLLAIAVSKKMSNSDKESRLVVIADSEFLTENFLRNSPQNLNFALNSVDWLTQASSLSGIRSKLSGSGELQFADSGQKQMVKYGNLIFVIVLPLAYGSFHLIRRRQRSHQIYDENSS